MTDLVVNHLDEIRILKKLLFIAIFILYSPLNLLAGYRVKSFFR